MESVELLDRAGRLRSPATLSGFHQGRVPRNKGSCRRRHEPLVTWRAAAVEAGHGRHDPRRPAASRSSEPVIRAGSRGRVRAAKHGMEQCRIALAPSGNDGMATDQHFAPTCAPQGMTGAILTRAGKPRQKGVDSAS